MSLFTDSDPQEHEFELLLDRTVEFLENHLNSNVHASDKYAGNKLEPLVRDAMHQLAADTPFENDIVLVSGQKFPDIVISGLFGVEIKSTTQNHWKTTGNSVLESSRVDGLKKVYLLFAKLHPPVSFRWKAYEDCLSDVVVTHSPRYLVDMNLSKGSAIFDKMSISYEDLRSSGSPLKKVVNYYKKNLKPGDEVWWIDNNESNGSQPFIRLWNNLEEPNKQRLLVLSMIFFPEVFSNQTNKFSRVSVYFIKHHSVLCPNIRDLFTAGGKAEIMVDGEPKLVPKIMLNLIKALPEITDEIKRTSVEELSLFWNAHTTEERKIDDWIDRISVEALKLAGVEGFNVKEAILEEMGKKNIR